ncbi:hypothetical protein TRFO_35323 [Tritrichomonas foetus]|uniref:Serine/threonine specific protein phosphatases domain-containing protein n=1 Tax=Tritrichomonas foetus TaxID=1144522 RepID=A0A1J4JL45_9EUKA|nr:hypothetical protein TRFO_35323 [Tritrichomonas foetus]|eukprot:OHS98291.1 hypothetical protein TRFO_35323 [Tritrichomonas foetus]
MDVAESPLCFKSPPKYVNLTEEDLTEDPSSALSKLYYNRSLTHRYLQDTRSALADATQSLNFNPRNPLAYLQRAELLISIRNFKPAYSDLMEVARITHRPGLVKKKADAARLASIQQMLFENLKIQTNPYLANNLRPKPFPKVVQPKTALTFDFDNFSSDDAISLINELKEGKMLQEEDVSRMISKIRELHENLPNIVNIEKTRPNCVIKVVGDTHGQFQDLVYIFEHFGNPTSENPYLFNGDYVDRGSQGLEILLTLFSWKIANPESIYFNRGNQYVILFCFHFHVFLSFLFEN